MAIWKSIKVRRYLVALLLSGGRIMCFDSDFFCLLSVLVLCACTDEWLHAYVGLSSLSNTKTCQ